MTPLPRQAGRQASATKKTSALTLRLAGRDVELRCVRGFTLVQELRAAIQPRCPKCGGVA